LIEDQVSRYFQIEVYELSDQHNQESYTFASPTALPRTSTMSASACGC
jgi:hypothetical protein